MFENRKKRDISVCKYTDPGGRMENEDSVAIFREEGRGVLAMLADGLGGHGGGKAASSTAVESVYRDYLSAFINAPEEFNIWFQKANQQILDMQTPECEMKTTLVCLLIKEETAMWAHIGDSRLYHFVDGKMVFRTFDHSVSQMAVLRGEIREDEIRGHADRNKLLKALGREETISIDVSEKTDLSGGGHAFLLCSDGFWEYVTEGDMQKTLKQSVTAEEWLRRMVKILKNNAKPGNDNNSAVAVLYRGERS